MVSGWVREEQADAGLPGCEVAVVMRWEASGRSMRGARSAGNGERGRLAGGGGREAGPEV